MNKLFWIAALVLSLGGEFSAVYACGPHEDAGMMKYGMKSKSSSMVASRDGGVIVLSGGTLYKYDKNLNLVKEVNLSMRGQGMEMKREKCNHCGGKSVAPLVPGSIIPRDMPPPPPAPETPPQP